MPHVILHGGIVKVEVIDPKHRRSPLVQGGLEIPVKVIIEMEHSTQGHEILARYQTLILSETTTKNRQMESLTTARARF